jgi:hypothetical protein
MAACSRLLPSLILSLALVLPARAEPLNARIGNADDGSGVPVTDGTATGLSDDVDVRLGIRPSVDALGAALRYTREALDACCGGFLVNLGAIPGEAARSARVYFDPGAAAEAEARASVSVTRGTASPLGDIDGGAEARLDARLARVLAALCRIDPRQTAAAEDPHAEASLPLGF